MFKRPADWTWAEEDLHFDWTSDAFKNNVNSARGEMQIDYLYDNSSLTTPWRFWSWANPSVYRSRDPFSSMANASTGGFQPMNYFIVTGITAPPVGSTAGVTPTTNMTITNGHNAISIYPIPYNASTNERVVTFAAYLKTHYLILKNQIREGNNVKLEFEAYGQNGEVVLRAYYDNLR